MAQGRVALYFAWNRAGEIGAPLNVLEDRFPALFELRRVTWPRFEHLADVTDYDQGIGGFLDHVQKANFAVFAEVAASLTGQPVKIAERWTDNGACPLDEVFLADINTLIIISFDSDRTAQEPSGEEVGAIRRFLDNPDHAVFVCPHHDIGDTSAVPEAEQMARREAEFHHHGDPAIPARQSFGGFGVSILRELGVPVKNRFGLRPRKLAEGVPAPIDVDEDLDHAGFLDGVESFNLHPHLPHFERIGDSLEKLDVLARQPIDLTAPAHPFTAEGRDRIDALLQAKPDVFRGYLLVCDTTLWSSTAGGLDDLTILWRNVLSRKSAFKP